MQLLRTDGGEKMRGGRGGREVHDRRISTAFPVSHPFPIKEAAGRPLSQAYSTVAEAQVEVPMLLVSVEPGYPKAARWKFQRRCISSTG